jgi:hypothetical protein
MVRMVRAFLTVAAIEPREDGTVLIYAEGCVPGAAVQFSYTLNPGDTLMTRGGETIRVGSQIPIECG